MKLQYKWIAPWLPVIADANNNAIQYNRYLKCINAVVSDMGLDPRNYGTHSMRSGGACEMFCEGRTLLEIKLFGAWRAIESVDAYMHPYNPDMHLYIPDFERYRMQRRSEYVRTVLPVDVVQKLRFFK